MRRQCQRGSTKAVTRKRPDLSDDLKADEARVVRFEKRRIELTDSAFENATIEVTSVVGKLRVENCILRNVALPDSKIPSLRIRDVQLVNCDLANVEMRELNATRVKFVQLPHDRLSGHRIHRLSRHSHLRGNPTLLGVFCRAFSK